VRRLTGSGLVGSACFLAADLAWLAIQRPPFAGVLAGCLGALVVVGAFLPGVANQVTLTRAHLAGPALVYTLLPSRLLQLAAVVTLAGLSDLADGAVARRLRQPSRLGGALDPVTDGLFFGAVALGLAVGGAYPPWLAAVVLGRYALPALVGGGMLVAGRRPGLEHTPLGQASTMVIAVAVGGLALLRGLGWPTGALLTISEIAIPAVALAAFANLAWVARAALLGR
jgi:phosphatidylglycerophosphate synthase